MEDAAFQDPALTIALAAAAGMLAQTIARAALVEGRRQEIAAGLRETDWESASPSKREARL